MSVPWGPFIFLQEWGGHAKKTAFEGGGGGIPKKN